MSGRPRMRNLSFFTLILTSIAGCGTWLEPDSLDLDGDGVLARQDCDDLDDEIGEDDHWADADADEYPDRTRGGGCLKETNPPEGFLRAREDGQWDCDGGAGRRWSRLRRWR